MLNLVVLKKLISVTYVALHLVARILREFKHLQIF